MKQDSYFRNFIGGRWTDGDAGRLQVVNPADTSVVAEVALAGSGDVDRAVTAARQLHDGRELSGLRPVERARLLHRMADYLITRRDEIATLLTLESGKPVWEAEIEVAGAARFLEYYAAQAEALEGSSIPLGDRYLDFTQQEPIGVSAQIIPWNFPLEMIARGIGPALAAGNACVIKTPELAPLACSCFAEAADAAGLPAGALNILCGYGHAAGAALVAHPGIDQVAFTGSVDTGRAVAEAAGRNLVPAVLELGGKSAAIVHEDADLDAVLSDLRWGIFFNAGQICSAMSRVIIHRSLKAEFLDRAAALARSLSVGPGIDRREAGPSMGALVSGAQLETVAGICSRAIASGARPVTGGHPLDHPGAFMAPTIFDQLEPEMEIARTEVFGPVLSVLDFDRDDDAIRLANGTDFGLVAGIYTRDLDRAMVGARRLRAGQVFINEWFAGGVETPFGGVGKSGYGREKGREALLNYVQTKNIAIRLPG